MVRVSVRVGVSVSVGFSVRVGVSVRFAYVYACYGCQHSQIASSKMTPNFAILPP